MARTTNLLSVLLWIIPIVASTTYSHFKEGPPERSWNLRYNLLITILRAYRNGPGSLLSLQQLQQISLRRTEPLPRTCLETHLFIPTKYREQGGQVLCKMFDLDDEAMIGWDWQADRYKPASRLQGSWILPIAQQRQQQQRTLLYLHGGHYFLGTYKLYRGMLGNLAELADARVLAVDYRLAPEHPFPTAVEDALASYLYMLDPPEDAPFTPIPPSQIVLSGDSAGGGLTMALMQAIRDTGLPMPAGAVLISPWLDLTHSLPSCQDNEITDYLPTSFNVIKKQEHDANAQKKATGNHHSPRPAINYCGLFSDDTVDQLHPYTHNRCLKNPLVSPLFDRYQWHGFPPLLIQVGDAEQLRDESICASFKATDQFDAIPPCLPTTTHHRPLKPTLITLDLYDDQPHVFQILMPSKAVRRSVLEMASFLHDITLLCDSYKPLTDPHPLTIRSISPTGWIDDVTEDMLKVHYGDVWQDWQDRLDNTSLKARLKHVVASRL